MIRKATEKDFSLVAKLAHFMWSNHTCEDLENEFADTLAKGNAVSFLMYEKEQPLGFAQCQLRHDDVEGSASSPLAILEGIFVKEAYRNHGYAKSLLKECETWAALQGCKGFSSNFQLKIAYTFIYMQDLEANRIICFIKKL